MNRTLRLLATRTAIAFTLAGCSSHEPSKPPTNPAGTIQPANKVPLRIVPSCQRIGNQHVCQWIEPR